MAKGRSIAEIWNGFAAAVMPNDACEVQRYEMRKAFYSGVMGIMSEMAELSRSVRDGSMLGDEAERRIEGWVREVNSVLAPMRFYAS